MYEEAGRSIDVAYALREAASENESKRGSGRESEGKIQREGRRVAGCGVSGVGAKSASARCVSWDARLFPCFTLAMWYATMRERSGEVSRLCEGGRVWCVLVESGCLVSAGVSCVRGSTCAGERQRGGDVQGCVN